MRFLLRRLAHTALLMFGVSILTYLFASLAPGDYFDEMRLNPQIAPETVLALRAQYQLDRPLPLRYVRWLDSVVHGISVTRFPITVLLARSFGFVPGIRSF